MGRALASAQPVRRWVQRWIAALARSIADIVGFRGTLVFDRSKPDGTPRKLLDVSKIHALGWHATTPLADGIRSTYDWYLANAK